ncbi:MAG: DUF1549 and DUF1553 domain-containing protein [Pirellulaceae bacterium]
MTTENTTRLGNARPCSLSRGALAAAGVVIWMLLVGLNSVPAQEEILADSANNQAPVDAAPINEIPITDADREHWAFRPGERPKLPAVNDSAWPRTAVDRFILARLEEDNLQPAGEANRAMLLRRLTFDLAGLPPTPEELAAFESDQRPDAYERVVDRLLASTAYGERWAQHWLDLARFAETDGFEHDKLRPDAWKYRDWVIAALNEDMPYDEFVTRQVAGDKVQSPKSKVQSWKDDAPSSPQSPAPSPALPTAFVLAGPDMPDINDQAERRHVLLNEATATVGAVLLGLQMGCAQCHDHKYDPVSQADFYRLRAVFESAVPPLKRDVPCNVLVEQEDEVVSRLWLRGDHRRPGAEVQPGFPRIATPTRSVSEDESPGATAGSSSSAARPSLTHRVSMRNQFAQWLFRDSNPLTARVMANRLWQHHFGSGIFDTPSDVGLINAGPTHPELLDWLATELRDGRWQLKRMHRVLLNSATYRQTSAPRRLDGESLRDAMLAAAGLLTSERGGPGVRPPLPPELVGTLLKDQWKPSPREAEHYRRSIYVFARRNLRYPIFDAFDRPDGNASCSVRNRSTTAPQSLLLFNSEFSLLAARHLASRILSEDPRAEEPRRQVERLYLLTLSRRPTAPETAALTKFLHEQRARLAAEGRPREELALPTDLPDSADPYAAAALVDACLAMFNANEFLYVD